MCVTWPAQLELRDLNFFGGDTGMEPVMVHPSSVAHGLALSGLQKQDDGGEEGKDWD